MDGFLEDTFSFTCSLKRLACLDGFLDHKEVWAFRLDATQDSPESTPNKSPSQLSVLTRMDDLADLWGPVWPVPVSNDSPHLIKWYDVSKGVICRVSKDTRATPKNAARCHWYSRPAFYARRASRLFRSEDLLLSKDELLLIGARFRENSDCKYTLDDFGSCYGSQMGVLGTRPSSWRTDTRSFAISVSKMIGIQMQGTQKKIPETTLKQHILDKWRNGPTRANPGILNHFLGVEISHCTGNARRISMKEMLLTKTVSTLLERHAPGWSTTTWGRAFWTAVASGNDESIFKLWTKLPRWRPQIAELVCYVLELLDSTEMSDDAFTAAFLHNNQEQTVGLDLRINDWAKVLQDSHLMAVYAFFNEVCLECETPNHCTVTCHGSHAYTALRTQIAVDGSLDRVKLQPRGQVCKTDDADGDFALMTIDSSVRGCLFGSYSTGVEVRDQASRPQGRAPVYVRASTRSYGGMNHPRVRAAREARPERQAHGGLHRMRAQLPAVIGGTVAAAAAPRTSLPPMAPLAGSLVPPAPVNLERQAETTTLPAHHVPFWPPPPPVNRERKAETALPAHHVLSRPPPPPQYMRDDEIEVRRSTVTSDVAAGWGVDLADPLVCDATGSSRTGQMDRQRRLRRKKKMERLVELDPYEVTCVDRERATQS